MVIPEITPPHVSVCVPLYNGGAYLAEALAGIQAQDFGDFEVLIVDDCSTDDGPDIARRFAAADARFRYVANDANLGLVGNWNRCIGLARGEWVKFLFQDDLIEPDCLSRLLDAGRRGGGFVASSRRLVYGPEVDAETRAWYEEHAEALRAIYRDRTSLSAEDYASVKLDHLSSNIVGEPSVTMVRRSLFATYGLFDARLSHICDSEMWDRLGANVGLEYVTAELAGFRVHVGAASALYRSKPFRGGAVDPIVELHDMCTSPHFATLRAVAERTGRAATLSRARFAAIQYAFDLARTLTSDGSDGRQVRRDLVGITERVQGYRRASIRHFLFRIERFLGLTRA